jgi:2-keto-4-pentenoate hydratase/2-oxohepta-3-ene-1,7-dioic acid hydratase in catechol pathway
MRIARAVLGSQTVFGVIADADGALTFDEIAGDPVRDGRPITATGRRSSVSLSDLLAPVAPPSKIVGFGRNYTGAPRVLDWRAGAPVIFLKPPSAIIGPGRSIVLPTGAVEVEPEAELAVVIGREARHIDAAEALDHVFGFTVVNDVTARDYMADGHWTRPKGYDSFCPMGPWIETDLDPSSVRISGTVDGVVVQSGSTSDMVMSVGALLAYAADIFTLLPGDVVLTGSPAGRVSLRAGQTVAVSVEGIGTLSNPVVSS